MSKKPRRSPTNGAHAKSPSSSKLSTRPTERSTPPILDYIRDIHRDSPRDAICVFIPEYVVSHWWEHVLHNQSALRLTARLFFTPDVMVCSVAYHLTGPSKPVTRGAASSIDGSDATRHDQLYSAGQTSPQFGD